MNPGGEDVRRITSGAPRPPPRGGSHSPAASLPLSATSAGASLQLPEKGRKPRGPDVPSPSVAVPRRRGETEAADLDGGGERGR